ncbi:velvet protein [Lambiella insularis]|nr:velvet protein [Lambiella insularis]
MASIIAVSNETESSMVRMTKDGRKLTYEMSVLQQPQRARACGSGAKCEWHFPPSFLTAMLCSPWDWKNALTRTASADRRPVDPPPVVELKILEGDAKTDITFSHNANFFLYTTLEPARPIAQSRGSTAPPPLPVLTGMPVAGMAYLDRPSPAGYFIFPDLSVRHEGKYRLSFNLFEELKEDKDADTETDFNSGGNPNSTLLRSSPMAPQSHVHFRLEVKSEPFIVFSAKKFPGLAESTQLSRVVAEQGCRVRIRRDVRMRRRDTKASKDYDEYEEEGTGYVRPDRYATPDAYPQQPIPDRARSVSNASAEAHTPYANIERRLSVHDMNLYNQAHSQLPAAPQPQSASSYSSHLSFGGPSATVYHTPALPSNSTATHQPTQNYVSNAPNYPYQPSTQPRQITPQQNYSYPTSQPYQYQSQPMSQLYGENVEYKAHTEYRRPSNPSIYHPPNQNSSLTHEARNPPMNQSYYSKPAPTSVARAASATNAQVLPPLKTLQPVAERKYDLVQSAGPVSGSSVQSAWDSAASGYPFSNTGQVSADTSARSGKRSFASVFDTHHIKQSIHGGMRPDTTKHGQDVVQIELDDGSLADEDELHSYKLLSYKRADGSSKHKKCPSPVS